MNERIKELSKEAWRQIDVGSIRGRHVAYTRIFAELIIKDCAKWIEHTDTNSDIQEDAKALLEHFGIEHEYT